MDFQFEEFRSSEFNTFSYENLIGYYNFLRLIPVQYLMSNSEEFKLCIREMLNRKIDILSIQTKVPSERSKEESDRATYWFLDGFMSIVDPNKYAEAQLQSQKETVKKLPRKKKESFDTFKDLQNFAEEFLDYSKHMKKVLSNFQKLSKENASLMKKYSNALKKNPSEQLSILDFEENSELDD